MKQLYIEFLFSGEFITESQTQKVIGNNLKNIQFPKGVIGFRTFYQDEIGDFIESKYNKSATTYFGKEFTLQDIIYLKGKNSILYQNMIVNKWNRVVQIKSGQFFPLKSNDICINN